MRGNLRTRSRLLLGFVAVHLVLSLAAGAVAWRLVDTFLASQAEARAQTVGSLVTYLRSDTVRGKMEELTGYDIESVDPGSPERVGTLRVDDGFGGAIEINYRNEAYHQASHAVLTTTVLFVVLGVLVFGVLAWLMALRIARPLEQLATASRRIGEGDLEKPIESVGSGEIKDLSRALDTMRSRLAELDAQHRSDERLRTLGTFTAVIAHEIRNPLSAIQLTTQLLRRQHPDSEALEVVMNEVERMELITEELLSYSAGVHVDPQDCDVAAVAADVFKLMRRQAEHAEVNLEVEGQARVHADPRRLRQVMLNLILNAIQAQQDGGVVRIICLADGFTVCDNGPGIPEARMATIFDPFTSERSGGTGLGLHIAKSIIDAHGGELTCENTADGACFTVSKLMPVRQA